MVLRKHAGTVAVPVTESHFQNSRCELFSKVPRNIAFVAHGVIAAYTMPVASCPNARSEAAPVRRNSVVAMQFGFLRAIAPVEILVGTE